MIKSGRALDERSLADVRAEREFIQYITGIGFEWLLEIEKIEIPLVLAQEFFTTFRFQHSAGVLSKSIQFRMFGKKLGMNLTEWSVRLGLVTERQAEAGAWLSRDMKQPGDISEFNCQAVWETITANAPAYHATSSSGTWINQPVLRLAQVFLGYNLFGQVNASSPISPTELYLMWCMKERRKVHLGYWLAHTCHMITIHPERDLTVCHIIGKFLRRNLTILFKGVPQPTLCPSPEQFDILCFVKTKLIRMMEGRYYFYAIGQSERHSSSNRTTLAISDKPTEEAKREGSHKRKVLTYKADQSTEESPENRRKREPTPKGKEIEKEAPTKEEDTGPWKKRIEELINRLVETSTAHQATMMVQTAQLTRAVNSLEVTLKQMNDHCSHPRRQVRGITPEDTHDSASPPTQKRPRHDASPPVQSHIPLPHQRPRSHQSTSSGQKQHSTRFPP